jgi:hypothetical protein
MELDLGRDDDQSDAGSEKSKFKDDSDDTYGDTSADPKDPSKFKDDQDEDDDQETDVSNEKESTVKGF